MTENLSDKRFGNDVREERAMLPDRVKKSTGDLLAALNWHHGDDEIDRDVHDDR